MNYLYKQFLIISLLFLVLLSGCKKFVDVNQNPNQVTDQNITPDLLFTQAAHSVGVQMGGGNFRFLSEWLGYWSITGDFALPQNEATYNIDNTFTDPIWESYYNNLFDLYLAKNKALAAGDTVLSGASMILSVKLWQELVDMFGDIPYSQAFNSSKYPQPKFDKAQDVYKSLLNVLDTAINYMQQPAPSSFAVTDIVNKGDQTLWIKFANTLRLRLLLHQSEVPGFDPGATIAKIEATGGVQEAGDNVSVNPGYSNAVNKQNPFYANYGLTPTGVTANTLNTANAYFINLLESTDDPRLSRFFLPNSNGQYAGSVYGLAAGNPPGKQTSNIGPGLANNSSQDQWIMPAFESLFMEAEAIARGWLPGNAKQKYQEAVTENFVWLGVPDAVNAANTYMANNPIANWDESAGSTAESQAKFIAYQKYIALGGIDPIEAWVDLRRLNMIPNTGYITVNPGKISNTLPVRLPYPQTEYTTNGASVKAVGSVNIFTSKIFWQP